MLSPIEKLHKFINLEKERGYDNRAVVGGLDKIFPWWEKEAKIFGLSDQLIQDIREKLTEYPGASIEQRTSILSAITGALPTIQADPNAVAAANAPRPSQTREKQQESSAPPTSNFASRGSRTPSASQIHPTSIHQPVGLNASLTVLPGVGPRTAQSLSLLGLNTLEDLLYYFPRRYDDYSQLKPINRVEYGDELTLIATVESIYERAARGGQIKITEAVISDGTGSLRLTWFNQEWIIRNLHPGDQIVLSGKVDMYLGRFVINSPDWEPLESEHLHTNRIVPVYPLTNRITQKWLRRTMYQTISHWAPNIPDYLPPETRNKAKVLPLSTALLGVHFPDTNEQLLASRDRLAFDEIFMLQLGVLQQKRNWQSITGRRFDIADDWLDERLKALPYQLTNAQVRAIKDIRQDLVIGTPMNRLLQGDVGSGKTIVAALAAEIVITKGAQAAIMAPTSILAEQHYRNLTRLYADSSSLLPAEIRILTGDTKEAEREKIRSGLEDGSVKLLIGTHALIEDQVLFKDLQLVIIDEQHRFGVEQRSLLRAKGQNPHLLVMTATPIPRSLALTVYGDLDLSIMDELPPGRQEIETFVLHPLERERAYNLIRTQVSQGHQAFVIYPLVEQGDKDDAKAAVEEHTRLQSEIFPNLKLGLLHGRLKPAEKDQIMTQFRDGNFDILVSTSVIEVGVDVPNATIILIEGADRFGLSQLHQFRGRVGRGSDKSYCLLIPEKEDSVENKRLSAMAETNDGFILAQYDLDQRGPGDFLGTRQSGMVELKMANLTNIRLIEKTREIALDLFTNDPDLTMPENASIRQNLLRFWEQKKGDIS